MDFSRGFYKRRNEELDSLWRNNKKTKPVSKNISQMKTWSIEQAKEAIEVEKDYNKRNKRQSLFIKFPDTYLNHDIVMSFHPGIENVHFQHRSMPRFCFVTLKETAIAEDVINQLNKTCFGQGFLTVEYKKDEEEMNRGPEDINPLILYVGNLALEVNKEDLVKIYPKYRRIEIGYAKKMKFTRYAFVFFKNAEDSIEAFKKTYAIQLYNKSLILRFRRLHSTVGMSRESKPQLQQNSDSVTNLNNPEEKSDSNSNQPQKLVDVSAWDSSRRKNKFLLQDIPQRKDWSVEELKRAIEFERDYKRNRTQTLVIKFPDTDLNQEIVSGFHSGIKNVHFQQRSAARFCIVTLKETAIAEEVINQLNKTCFGQGFLTAEYKKGREDEMNLGLEDIDPLTLYVGNLALEVNTEDMVKIYPKHTRVDIVYANKLKYMRYAFVSFKNVDDSIEAFKKTLATQLYNRSLIVKFRRLQGTFSMPGKKPKLNSPKQISNYIYQPDES